MLSDGELEAIISPIAPRAFRDGEPEHRPAVPDPRAVELDHYRQTGLFPLMHCVVLRRALVEAHPGLPAALYKAFEAARRLAAADLDGRDYPKIASPWLSSARQEAPERCGRDPWTYGVEANRSELAALRPLCVRGRAERPPAFRRRTVRLGQLSAALRRCSRPPGRSGSARHRPVRSRSRNGRRSAWGRRRPGLPELSTAKTQDRQDQHELAGAPVRQPAASRSNPSSRATAKHGGTVRAEPSARVAG
jgi:hypothetical protein